jgi:uncharacterized protein YbaP (TraB family)
LRRAPVPLALALVALLPVTGLGRIRPQAAAPAPTASPLLWKIGTTTPSYLFGTIHVPDARVVSLPPAVERALDEAQALFTEIPMDQGTQLGIMSKVLLPGEQKLADVIGAPLAARLEQAVVRTVPQGAPPGTANLVNSMLMRMKPWAAMTQLSVLEFLPDLMAGRKPLDSMLWSRAADAGKEVGSLETVDEQLAVFERFSPADQKRMLEMTLDALDEGAKKPKTLTQELIDAYLTGDLEILTQLMNDAMKADRELMARFTAVALDARNEVMAARIRERLAARPGKSCFFAVGAAHYAGPHGVVALLDKAGLPATRVR